MFRFQCPECGFGHHEVGHMVAETEVYCVVCLEEGGGWSASTAGTRTSRIRRVCAQTLSPPEVGPFRRVQPPTCP